MSIDLTLIILALLGFYAAFVCGRQSGQGVEKLNSALRCTKCALFFGIEPIWLNRHLRWSLYWQPKSQIWAVSVKSDTKSGHAESTSITEACSKALKEYNAQT